MPGYIGAVCPYSSGKGKEGGQEDIFRIKTMNLTKLIYKFRKKTILSDFLCTE
jgi:hypothetical protein